jgi:hypothetical protein
MVIEPATKARATTGMVATPRRLMVAPPTVAPAA